MPELPEVETVRRDLVSVLPGKQIKQTQILDKKIIQSPNLAEIVTGKIFAEPQRQGKYLILPFENLSQSLILHLRMTGVIIYRSPEHVFASGHPAKFDIDALPDKSTRLSILLSNGGELFFHDQRRFGTAELIDNEDIPDRFEKFGIEPGTEKWVFSTFDKAISSRKAPIKAVLLNQYLIFGIGNIYADEALFRANILPSRRSDSLTLAEKKRLFTACAEVIEESIALRGTSIRNYFATSGDKGGFAEKLRVHTRRGKPCLGCGTTIIKTKCAGRGTYYCSKCQR